MKKNERFVYWLLSIFLILTSCSNKERILLEDRSFIEVSEIARLENKPFCITLLDTTKLLSKEYLYSLQTDYSSLTEVAIFNIVDMSSIQSEWYYKWLIPISLPLTCVFSTEGELIDLIPGSAKESFLYTEKAILEQETTDYHWPNRFQKSKTDVLPFLGQVIAFKNNIDNSIFQQTEFKSTSDSLKYPLIYYLQFKAASLDRDTATAVRNALEMLLIESSNTLELYKDEFIEAKKMVNPAFSLDKAPNIRTTIDKIVVEGAKIGQSMPIDIVLYNDGEEPLKIEKINMSCTCLRLDGADEGIVIEGKESYTARFYFTPENEGDVSRDVFVASKALNQPNLHINIFANVTP